MYKQNASLRPFEKYLNKSCTKYSFSPQQIRGRAAHAQLQDSVLREGELCHRVPGLAEPARALGRGGVHPVHEAVLLQRAQLPGRHDGPGQELRQPDPDQPGPAAEDAVVRRPVQAGRRPGQLLVCVCYSFVLGFCKDGGHSV